MRLELLDKKNVSYIFLIYKIISPDYKKYIIKIKQVSLLGEFVNIKILAINNIKPFKIFLINSPIKHTLCRIAQNVSMF